MRTFGRCKNAASGEPNNSNASNRCVRERPAHIVQPHWCAFADGSSWQHVIPLLVRDGYTVVSSAIPMASIDGDVAVTKRLIDAQKGPVVVVGHSYGGAVMTGAAAGNPNV